MEPTRSAEEALRVLKEHRSALVLQGRAIARRQCIEYGTSHSRSVRAEMIRLGHLDEATSTDERWLGAVFADNVFEKTGETLMVEDDRRNIHRGRPVQVWRLAGSGPKNPPTLQEKYDALEKKLDAVMKACTNLKRKYDELLARSG
jgi:hypothetical protein